ncbi:MAG TPA: type II toxin-antitoxin system VapC family toxin [Nitrososphaerales archaeon]|nr:type II toxin-antitoxin system VapC family toxin [Nitrososphaerales archaeon]
MRRLLVDANIFLELELGQSKSAECKGFLSKVANGRLKAATTDFILDSVAVVMEDRESPASDIRKFFASLILYKGLLVHNLDLKGRILATEEMDGNELDFDDSTSLVAMRRLGIKEIVSFDRDFDKVPGIERVEPKTALARM